MSICVEVVNGVLQASSSSCELVVISKDQLTQLVNGQFDWSLLEFDKDLYSFVTTQALISFVSGHVLGRIIKYFGKA
ncbi:transcriptional regulator [Vibrio porteresiae]|uniref:Transcriptional regulator n=1 Tax=Vibrio porteresiae DSM 19223 TaxID=1123496 RepID=A0ABZ0Q7Y7_9VIBR|nr:transcriptional regulator [Vibrio porteresiae]WPC72552.1 transcriptional regulator [Vibrio porteresiae DSM 19223]